MDDRQSGADEVFQDVGKGPWRLSRSRFSIVNDEHKWTLKFFDGDPHRRHDHAQIQENCERLCWTLNHIAQLEARLAALEGHGPGQCAKIGRTYTRPEFHIDPDDI